MKIGDTVYQIDACRVYPITVRKIIYDCGYLAFDDDAKKALNGSGENG